MKKLWSKTLKTLINELIRPVHCEKLLKKAIYIIVRLVKLKMLKDFMAYTIKLHADEETF